MKPNRNTLGVTVVAILTPFLFFATKMYGQHFITTPTKPGSSNIEVCPPLEIHGGYSGPVAPNPLGVKITAQNRLTAVLKVMAANSGTGFDIYYQHSADDGQTWCDFAHIQVAANTTGT